MAGGAWCAEIMTEPCAPKPVDAPVDAPKPVVITRTSVLGLWYPGPVCVRGQRFHHLEGWLQYCKHAEGNFVFAREIAGTPSASVARAMGDERMLWADLDLGKRALKVEEVEAWHARRPRALREGLWARVGQDRNARQELLRTRDAHLEYVDDDAPWYARHGNHLGLELMKIRDELRGDVPGDSRPPPRAPPVKAADDSWTDVLSRPSSRPSWASRPPRHPPARRGSAS